MIVGGKPVTIAQLLTVSIVFDGSLGLILLWFFISAERSRYALLYLSPTQFRTLKSIAEVVINGEGALLIPAEDVATNVDRYFKNFEARSKWIAKLVLSVMQIYPLFSLNVPLSYMNPNDRLEYLKKRFYQEVTLRLIPEFMRIAVQAMIRMSKQLCYMGYYNDPRTFESIGYRVFSKRPDMKERIDKFPIKPQKTLYVKNEKDIKGDVVNCDVAIIGSGAAASVLAQGLIEKGRSVLMIERGRHVIREEVNEDEMEMVSKLYSDGALQLASDFRFQCFQGSCVGGSTVVNNAVCFDIPDTVLDLWIEEGGLNSGLNKAKVKEAAANARKLIGIFDTPNLTDPKYLNPSGRLFMEGIEKMKLNGSPHKSGSVSANIKECLGCGYCNIGCAYGKKLSMLDTVLPNAQEKYGRNALEIISECEAIKLESKGNKINQILCRFRNGRKITVKANTFILSAGAISSSIVLLKSGISKNAGKRLSFNLGSQITASFKEPINSYDGLQISHYLNISPSRGYIIETWFNPPMFQSTGTPGWFEEHFKNMARYNRLACAGVLVGTESNAEVRVAGLTGRDIRYKPAEKDFNFLLDGLELTGRIFLEAGAECVIPNTFKYYEFKNENELKSLRDVVRDTSDITLGSGHPQGGNVMCRNPEIGVVDSDFKVFGYDNLYVCDASVFPSSVCVNPQLTVMTLADYAVNFIK
jgi:choline dehydrogenase-like flavoprotein